MVVAVQLCIHANVVNAPTVITTIDFIDEPRVRVEAVPDDNLNRNSRSANLPHCILFSLQPSSSHAALRPPAHAPAWHRLFICPSLPPHPGPLLLDSQRRSLRTCFHRSSASRTEHGPVPSLLPPAS